VGISLGSAGIPSYQKAYRRADRRNYDADTSSWSYDTVTFPAMMAVIRVEEGNVKEITWDDTCNWCESTRCASNTYTYAGVLADTGSSACFVPDTECVVAGSEQVVNTKLEVDVVEECKLRVYITWTGTDSKGFHFLSAATRFSRLSSTQMEHIVIGGGA